MVDVEEGNSSKVVSVTESNPDRHHEMGCGTLSGEEEAEPVRTTMGCTWLEQAVLCKFGRAPELRFPAAKGFNFSFFSFFFLFLFLSATLVPYHEVAL